MNVGNRLENKKIRLCQHAATFYQLSTHTCTVLQQFSTHWHFGQGFLPVHPVLSLQGPQLGHHIRLILQFNKHKKTLSRLVQYTRYRLTRSSLTLASACLCLNQAFSCCSCCATEECCKNKHIIQGSSQK